MKTRVRRRSVIAVALTCTALTLGLTAASSGGSGPQVVVLMNDAGPLEPGNEVRVSGVKVGAIDGIALEDGHARVTLSVDQGVLPLHRDASVTVRPVNLLGEDYVDLNPGSPDQPFAQQASIPLERSHFAVTLQDVLNTFHDPTASALAATVTTLGEGVDGAGPQAAAAIKALAPAMTDAQRLGDVLSGQNQVLGDLLGKLEPVSGALAADDGQTLAKLVQSTTQTLSAVAGEQNALDRTLTELPSTVATARQTLANLAGVADSAIPALRAIKPVTGNLSQVTDELQAFSDAADPALSALRPVLDHAEALLGQAAPAVAALRQAGPDLRGVAASAKPVAAQLLDQHLGDLMDFVRKWALSTNGRDGLSHYFRGVVYVTPQTLQDLAHSLLPAVGGAPAAPGPQQAPNLPLPPGGTQPLNGLLGGGHPDPGNATGLTPDQEQSMLGQLLGGL
ncbi:MCE family protein [Amycolatopsis sp. K13G38]|uniref:MCE family protein n=1 Tax=Amycolatopsis acididurans TaxID=2724524 RepID=A0ABX1J3M1_9PSEU|nr:MlaD family protein [Amycolatopsis acididurans]NKQ54229.1 MCE family protein [Amycolatopsis acididurans]